MDGTILKAFISLSVIILALIAILFVLKRYAKKNSSNKSNNNRIDIISKTSLTPKNHIFLIKSYNKTLMVGVSENGINLISDMSETQDSANSKINLNNKTTNNNLELALEKLRTAKAQKNQNTSKSLNTKLSSMSENEFDKSLSFATFLKSAFSKDIN